MAVPKTGNAEQAAQAPVPKMDFGNQIKTVHNRRLYKENAVLKDMINDLAEYQITNPQKLRPASRAEIDRERAVELETQIKKKKIRAQLSVIKTLFRQSVLKVREEKALTAESRSVNDSLILKLNNLKYEASSLGSEISAAQNYDHAYKKLKLIPIEEFLAEAPDLENASEHELMKARIEHERQSRLKLEEARQEKLKSKQMLIAKSKKGKDDLTKLDGMLEKFIEAAEPIKKALATE